MDHKEKIEKCDIYLKNMFNELISDEIIKKTRFDNLILEDDKAAFEPNIEKTFYKEYFSTLFFMNKKNGIDISFIIIIMHFLFTVLALLPSLASIPFNNGEISIIFFIFCALITNAIGVKIIRKLEIGWQKEQEEKIKYCRDDLITQFINNDLMFRKEYLENKKFEKKSLQKIINFIQENLSKEELTEFLMVSKTEDISDPNNVFLLIQEIRNKHLNAILAEENKNERLKKEKNIDKMLNAIKEKEVVTV